MFLFFLSSFSLTASSLPSRDSLLLNRNRMPTELHALEVIPCNSGRWKRALLCSAGHQRLLYAKTVSAWAGCQTLKSLASLTLPGYACHRHYILLYHHCHAITGYYQKNVTTM